MNDIDYTVLFDDDIVSDSEGAKHMILYAYVDNRTATDLFKYYSLLQFKPNELVKKNIQNPIQLPITLYEYPEIAKAVAPKINKSLLELSINISIPQIYDSFNPFSNVKEHDQNVFLIRKRNKYNETNKEYISYTVKHAGIIDSVKILN